MAFWEKDVKSTDFGTRLMNKDHNPKSTNNYHSLEKSEGKKNTSSFQMKYKIARVDFGRRDSVKVEKRVSWCNYSFLFRVKEDHYLENCKRLKKMIFTKRDEIFHNNWLRQWFPTFFLSRRILEKNENYLAHLEYFEYKIFSN